MLIKIFGPGCAKCKETEQVVKDAVETSGRNARVENITDLREMMSAGLLSTPAVSIDGTLVCAGRVPSRQEVMNWMAVPDDGAKDC